MDDEGYMKMAIDLSEIAMGRTSPNPMVGAVLVKHDRVIGFGAHLQAGTAHAEIHALTMAGEEARGSTLYVTLEPCAHHGRTPPCAPAVAAAGVRRVVIAVEDPFHLVAGRGVAILRSAGIEVSLGCLAAEASRSNEVYLHYARTGRPFVILKLAATLDGRIADQTGQRMTITGPEAQLEVHRLRNVVDVIAVGVGTVLADDPLLTTRLAQGGRSPVRVIFDRSLRTPVFAQVVQDRSAPTIIVCDDTAEPGRIKSLEEMGVEVWALPASEQDNAGRVRHALRALAERGLMHVLVEGGSTVAAAFIQADCVDRLWFFHAPTLLCGGMPAVSGSALSAAYASLSLRDVHWRTVGSDSLMTATPERRDPGQQSGSGNGRDQDAGGGDHVHGID